MVDPAKLRSLIERDFGERGIAAFARAIGVKTRKAERWVSPTKPQPVSAMDLPKVFGRFPELREDVPVAETLAAVAEKLDRCLLLLGGLYARSGGREITAADALEDAELRWLIETPEEGSGESA